MDICELVVAASAAAFIACNLQLISCSTEHCAVRTILPTSLSPYLTQITSRVSPAVVVTVVVTVVVVVVIVIMLLLLFAEESMRCVSETLLYRKIYYI